MANMANMAKALFSLFPSSRLLRTLFPDSLTPQSHSALKFFLKKTQIKSSIHEKTTDDAIREQQQNAFLCRFFSFFPLFSPSFPHAPLINIRIQKRPLIKKQGLGCCAESGAGLRWIRLQWELAGCALAAGSSAGSSRSS